MIDRRSRTLACGGACGGNGVHRRCSCIRTAAEEFFEDELSFEMQVMRSGELGYRARIATEQIWSKSRAEPNVQVSRVPCANCNMTENDAMSDCTNHSKRRRPPSPNVRDHKLFTAYAPTPVLGMAVAYAASVQISSQSCCRGRALIGHVCNFSGI